MLEFWIDPESPYHKPVFAQDKKFCSSRRRLAFAPQPRPPAHVASALAPHPGGFSEWKKSGKPVDYAAPKENRDSFVRVNRSITNISLVAATGSSGCSRGDCENRMYPLHILCDLKPGCPRRPLG